jgi:putative FmdB family regulatory protein
MYEYQCANGHRFEKIEKFSAPTVQKCPKCGAKAERQISRSAVQFKGSGWYVTDYGGKSTGGDGADAGKTASADSGGDGNATAKVESKADAKGDGKDGSKTESKPESKASKPGEGKSSSSKPRSSSKSG